MVDLQQQEKIEDLSARNRALVDRVQKLERANLSLSSLLASRNETVVMLEDESRKAKAAARKRKAKR